MKFTELVKSVGRERKACYLLSGDDPFVIESAVKFFTSLVELPEMNLIRLNSPLASDIVAAASVFPFMSPLRLVIVENFVRSAEELHRYLLSPSPHSTIVIVSPSLTSNLSEIKKDVTIVDCSKQDEGIVTSYIARKCSEAGVKVTTQAAKLLIGYCCGSMTRISVELSKLISFRMGGTIESADVEKMVSPDLEYRVFDLGDCLANKDAERALAILDDMLKGSGNSSNVFGLIYSHFRKLLYVAISPEDTVKSCLGISDYPYKKLKAQAKSFSPVKLKRICDELHAVDSDYKSGLISDKLAINNFAMHIVNEGR